MNSKLPDILAEPPVVDEGPAEVAAPVATPLDENRLYNLLTAEELAKLDARADKQHRDEQRRAQSDAYLQARLNALRREDGVLPAEQIHAEDMAEECRVVINLPSLRKANGGELPPDPIILDQTRYYHGSVHIVPKGRAIYLWALMDQMRRHVNAVDGRSQSYGYYNGLTTIYQGGIAGGGASHGAGFDAIHRRPA